MIKYSERFTAELRKVIAQGMGVKAALDHMDRECPGECVQRSRTGLISKYRVEHRRIKGRKWKVKKNKQPKVRKEADQHQQPKVTVQLLRYSAWEAISRLQDAYLKDGHPEKAKELVSAKEVL